MKKRDIFIVTALTLVITFMDISGLPAVALFQIRFADVNPVYISLMMNFCLITLLGFLTLRIFCPDWELGLHLQGIWEGLKRYAPAGMAAGLLSGAAFWIGLRPFDYEHTVWKVLIEGILYYIGVGFVEELYVRGLFLNVVEKIAYKRGNKTNIAIAVSSVVFGLGHIPGMLGMGALVITFKLISTIGMGLYFGVIYKKTGNLWIPILLHAFIDVCALPYCFTTFSGYKLVSLVGLLVIYVSLGVYSIGLMKAKK